MTLHDVWHLGIEFGISLDDWIPRSSSATPSYRWRSQVLLAAAGPGPRGCAAGPARSLKPVRFRVGVTVAGPAVASGRRNLARNGWEWAALEEMRLEARDFAGPGRWRWVLTGPGGMFLADHEVRLDTGCWQFEAFTGLGGVSALACGAGPAARARGADRRRGGRLDRRAGAGAGRGGNGAARPATVRVVVPAESAGGGAAAVPAAGAGQREGSPLAAGR